MLSIGLAKSAVSFCQTGVDRLSEAESQFWQWWQNGGDVEFAREKGLINGNATVAGTGSEGSSGSDPSEATGPERLVSPGDAEFDAAADIESALPTRTVDAATEEGEREEASEADEKDIPF